MALLVALGLVLTACGGSDEPSSVASPVSTTIDSSTTTAPEAWRIDEVPPPEEITVEYLQRVMDALDQGLGDAFRRYKADGGPTVENEPMLAELYVEPALAQIRSSWGQLAGLSFEPVAENPGDPSTVVQETVRSTPTCVLAGVRRSLDAMRKGRPSSDEEAAMFVALQPRPDGWQPTELNRTAWVIVFDGVQADGSTPHVCR